MLTVKILGPGCANCRKLEAVARQAASDFGVRAEFTKVTDMEAILAVTSKLATPFDLLTMLSEVVNAAKQVPALDYGQTAELVFPEESVAQHVTVVTPIGKVRPSAAVSVPSPRVVRSPVARPRWRAAARSGVAP